MNNRGRKWNVMRDDLNIKGGGLYCVTPFDKFDEYGKTIFKIGLATKIWKRMEDYHTVFPAGLYICDVLENPTVRRGQTKTSKYKEIEKFIFNYIVERGAIQIRSTTRVRGLNERNKGVTEWFYSNEYIILEAFKEAKNYFGGYLYQKKLPLLNAMFGNKIKRKPNFNGNILYTLEDS